jgi:hypothetical protein
MGGICVENELIGMVNDRKIMKVSCQNVNDENPVSTHFAESGNNDQYRAVAHLATPGRNARRMYYARRTVLRLSHDDGWCTDGCRACGG